MSEISVEDFKLVFRALWNNKLIILLVTMAGGFAGMFFTAWQPQSSVYQATSSVCVTYNTYTMPISSGSVMLNYSDIVMSNRVCESAAQMLSGSGLTPSNIQNMINMSVDNNSYVMQISAKSVWPQLAVQVTNAVAEAFVSQVSTLSGNTSLQVLDMAETASIVSNNGMNQLRILAAAGAFLLTCGWISLRELLSNKVRSIPQCVEDEDEILAIIPYAKF